MAEYELNGIKLSVPDVFLNDKIAEKLSKATYEADEAKAALMRLRPDQRVLDIGSGIGYIASLCARIAGPENVMTAEANPDMIKVIRDNLDQNGFQEVDLFHGAVCETENEFQAIEFERKPSFWASQLADEDSDPNAVVSVPFLSLTDLLSSHRPHLVTMDIEGAEQYLFDNIWPGHVHYVIVELHPSQYPDRVIKKIVDCMSASGLTYDPGPSRGRIICFRKQRNP